MRAINLIFSLMLFSPLVSARDQDWGILQARKKTSGGDIYFAEYVRRDNGRLFDDRFFDLYRFSWGQSHGKWTYLLGAAYLDFEKSADEKRTHQFLIRGFQKASLYVSGLMRLGLEQRFFNSDPYLYWRARARVNLNLLPQYSFGPSFYNELFWMPEGHRKFASGFNENRFGMGLRYIARPVEIYFFYVKAMLESPTRTSHPDWGQVQLTYDF